MVTVTVTSCGRLSLLEQTLASFLLANDYEFVHEILIVEDSGDAAMCRTLRGLYEGQVGADRPTVKILCNHQRLGQMRALDRVWGHVTTPWVFHLEDDWLFDGTGGFIQDSLDILLDNPLCFQVHVRERASAIHPLHATRFQSLRRGARYRRLVYDWASHGHKLWHGFSMGPGLRRTQLLRVLGPMEVFGSELLVQAAFQSLGLWAAALETGVLDHAGQHDSKRHQWETSLLRPPKL